MIRSLAFPCERAERYLQITKYLQFFIKQTDVYMFNNT